MKKRINTQAITNELSEGSVFFPPTKASESSPLPVSEPQPHLEIEQHPEPGQPQYHDTLIPVQETQEASLNASKHDSSHASTLAQDIEIKALLKTLKLIGKEVLYVRLTQEEKNQVTDIEYTYQRQGIKTSGNEIGRIALNVLLTDYKVNGEQSILAKLLTELHT